MGAGWLYYHKQPPRRKCPMCGKRHYLKRIGGFSNGQDVWRLICPDYPTAQSNIELVTWHGQIEKW